MQQLALRRGEVVVDGVAHQRVHEAERRVRPQDLRAGQGARGGRDALLVGLGHRRDSGQAGAVAQHRDGARDRDDVGRQPRQPQEHGARHRARTDFADRVGVSAVGPHVLRLQRLEQLPHEQRIAAGRLMTRGAERLLGIGSQPSAHELGHGGLAQLVRMHRDRHGIVGDLGEQPRVGRLLGRARGRHDEDVQAFQPALEVRDETQRRLVTPMQVVDQQQQRPVGGDVRRDPEQAVEDAEGDVGLGGAVIGGLEHPRRRLRGPGQPPCPVARVDQDGIEQLPHDAERQLALEVAPAGGEHTESGLLGRFASRGEQPALPDPGRPFEQRQALPALERALDQLLENTELTVALEQLAPRLGIDRHRRAC